MTPDTRASRRAVWRRRNCCCCCAFGVGREERTIVLPLLLPGCSTSVLLLCPVMSVGVMFVPVFWGEPGWICLFSSSSNISPFGALPP